MEAITQIFDDLRIIVWGPPALILILGVGLYLTFGLRLSTTIKIPFGFDLLWKGHIKATTRASILSTPSLHLCPPRLALEILLGSQPRFS